MQKHELGIRKLRGNDIEWSNPYGEKLNTSFATLKALMQKTLVIIVKK
jgi:hypothetical protein